MTVALLRKIANSFLDGHIDGRRFQAELIVELEMDLPSNVVIWLATVISQH